ncbi:acyloxyacyl hydrolase [Chitinophaga silvatica]|nr:acyloxyacyl hydrolase [Chitinophaga silvatica]
MNKCYRILLLLSIGLRVAAQDTTDLWLKAKSNPNLGRHKFLELKLHAGVHLYEGDELKNALDNGYKALEVRMGWMSTGRQTWQRVFNYPSYGIGFYTGDIGNPSVLGKPNGLYGFFFAPVHRRPKNHFEIGVSLGITYDLKTYNATTNPTNDAISSKTDVYFNLTFSGIRRLSPSLDLIYGLDLTHYSNGRMHMPNLGLNMAGPHIGIRYHYNTIRSIVRQQIDSTFEVPRRPTYIPMPIPPVKHTQEISLYGAVGMVQLPKDEGIQATYFTSSLVFDYYYRISHKSSIGGGVDGFYDGSLGYVYEKKYGTVKMSDKMLMGLHLGYMLHIQKFAVILDPGLHVIRKDNEKSLFFARVAVRYKFGRYGFVQIGLKTVDGFVADWVEWGGGGRYMWQNRK